MTVLLILLALLVITLTVLPVWRTTLWWVRLMDFPRLQIAVFGVGVVAALLASGAAQDAFTWLVLICVSCATLWQLNWIWRFFPGAPIQSPAATGAEDAADEVSFVTANVLQENRTAEGLLRIIAEADPDFVLAVETDEWWVTRLTEDLDDRYPHRFCVPQSNGYGMSVFSKLELEDVEIQHLLDDAIPSIRMNVVLRSGQRILVHAVHPQPPRIGQDSLKRDIELDRLATIVARHHHPAVVLGDLNDVGWSTTTQRFLETSNLRDPRRGRGLYNTYPAAMPGLRYPLDHIFISHHFALRKLRVLPSYSSDHLPLFAALRLSTSALPKK